MINNILQESNNIVQVQRRSYLTSTIKKLKKSLLKRKIIDNFLFALMDYLINAVQLADYIKNLNGNFKVVKNNIQIRVYGA